jgi:hypothetical protein
MPTPNYRAALTELLAHFNTMQDFCAQYMPPDSGITEHDFANNMIGFLDGPEQRRVQTIARAVLAEPEAGAPDHVTAAGKMVADARPLEWYEAEAQRFFEWPEGSKRQGVTLFSALLFAQHCAAPQAEPTTKEKPEDD